MANERDGAARARAAAAQVVHAVERGTALDTALESPSSRLPPDQRSLLAELSYGTVGITAWLRP